MLNHQLTKREKKIAREIIDKGLIAEFEKGLSTFDMTLNDWKSNKKGTKEAYYELFEKLKRFDKLIEQRYDNMSGSRYLITVIEIVRDGFVKIQETEKFESKTKEIIKSFIDSN